MNYLDLHCDTMYAIWKCKTNLDAFDGHINRRQMKVKKQYVQCFGFWCGQTPIFPGQGKRKLMPMLETAREQFSLFSDDLALCKTSEDLAKALAERKAAALLSLEGAELLDTPDDVPFALAEGIRMVGLSWNHDNQYITGASTQKTGSGLTMLGKTLVRRLEDHRIAVDVSHASDAGFWDVLGIARRPVVASHSNARAVCHHRRNLTDEMFRAIVQSGGLVGINLYVPFIKFRAERCEVDDLLFHIEHFLSLGGEDALAFGADFDGCDVLPNGISGLSDTDRIAECLLRRNYPERLVQNILFENGRRFFMQNLPEE